MSALDVHGCITVILLCYFTHSVTAVITSPEEVTLLLDIKKSLIDPMKHLDSWNNGDPCTSNWTGVFCSDTILHDGYLHVERIHLLNMNLSGTLSPSLSQLPHLHLLDFMWNDLTGSIPKEIGNMTSLRLLLLSGNQLSGSLPEELGNLKNLDRLQIDENNISGPVPKSFGNMKSVRHLHMNNNSINGQIPSDISKLSRLHHLLLDNNNLSGYLPPELSYIPELRILQLDNNNFGGTEVPASYGSIPRLAKISLRNCNLQGAIPDFSGIWSFMYLDLSYNRLSGSIPSKFPADMTTIDLSDNHLNGSIPASFSDLPNLQILSLKNNMLTGSVAANIWKHISFNATTRLTINLQNNSLSGITGSLDPPQNVTLRLQGNPVCRNPNIKNISLFCGHQAGKNETYVRPVNSTMSCPIQACPSDDFFEYSPASLEQCFCASPLQIGYRLKSPSFSYFPPFEYLFKSYLTSSLELNSYQLLIDSLAWEQGPRLRMYLKIFPIPNDDHSSTFNRSEVLRLRSRFTQWEFPPNDFFGPYEILNFTLLGPYSNMKSESSRRKISKGVLAIIILGSIASAALISVFAAMFVRRHNRSQQGVSGKRPSPLKIDGVKSFTYDEMVLATDNFNSSSQIGRGGYGKVYRGILSDGTVVAIKRAEEGSLQGGKEFLTETELLSRLHHRNLVQLIGYCDEAAEQMIVYEYMPNGTLREWLYGKAEEKLNFGTRLRIALGAAKGILYLHTEVQPPIFHRDIKSSNILLDSTFTAKVADFGLSRSAPNPDDEGNIPNYVSTAVKGTPGYLDPEYFLTHKLTDKSDVYSLGVVFLELLTGLHPIMHGKNLVREVNIAYQSDMPSIIDSRMGSYPSECVERFVFLALSCCEDKPEKRPSILDVLIELEHILRIYLDTEITLSKSLLPNFGISASTSSSLMTGDANVSEGLSGNDLSGIVSTIVPR